MPTIMPTNMYPRPNNRYSFQELMQILFDQVGMGVNFSGIKVTYVNGRPFRMYYDTNESLCTMYSQLITIATKKINHTVSFDTPTRSMINYGMYASRENGFYYRQFPEGNTWEWKCIASPRKTSRRKVAKSRKCPKSKKSAKTSKSPKDSKSPKS